MTNLSKMHNHNNALSMISGAILGVTKAITTTAEISGGEIVKVLFYGGLGALGGLIVKDIYHFVKKKLQ